MVRHVRKEAWRRNKKFICGVSFKRLLPAAAVHLRKTSDSAEAPVTFDQLFIGAPAYELLPDMCLT